MSNFSPVEITPAIVMNLREWLQRQESIFSIESDNAFLLICYSLACELGGVNDELAKFIHDDEKKKPVATMDLKAEIGISNGQYCLRISCVGSSRISVSVPELLEVVICRGSDIVITPSSIVSKIKDQGLTPVVVRDWLKRAIFSGFDPKKMSYRDQLWVLRNNEVMLYAWLVANKKVIFQDMHDITAHIAGLFISPLQVQSASRCLSL